MRTMAELDHMPAGEWSEEEAIAHLTVTFNEVNSEFPDLLEPYIVLLVDADTDRARAQIMRRGLRETFKKRHPAHPQPAERVAAE